MQLMQRFIHTFSNRISFFILIAVILPLSSCSSQGVDSQEEAEELSPTEVSIIPQEQIFPTLDLNRSPLAIKNISSWAYQIQGFDQPGAIEALVASRYDMVVIEPTRTDWGSGEQGFNTRSMVTEIKNSPASDGIHRKLVIAYINIGQAENWRWYWKWSTAYNCRSALPIDWPDFILSCDPDGWEGDYPVAYWDARWKDIVIYGNNQGEDPSRDFRSIIDEVIIDGFDGVYLDWVEGYENEQIIAAAKAIDKDPAGEMVQLIKNIRDYAGSRRTGFIIIQQNAAALSQGHEELFQLIDAIAQEGVWYTGDATDRWDDSKGFDQQTDPDLTNEYVELLSTYHEAGLPVFVCEYALSRAEIAYGNALNLGYIPYVTRTPLSRLTTTLPPNN
jgi:cysteinyl-tRNA synthetase